MLQIVATTDDPIPVPTDPEIDFDTFWACYPRKVARKAALRAWQHVPKTEYVSIMAALWSWRRYWDERGEPEYVMHASTFLNGERWTDELPPEYLYRPPKMNGAPVQQMQAQGERVPMPEHVRAMIAKLRESKK